MYCRTGRRSGIAKTSMVEAGFSQVTNLGGMTAW
ncbi:MAG: rhodanese-like domain-containing protein [Nannocystaceae bacterium]